MTRSVSRPKTRATPHSQPSGAPRPRSIAWIGGALAVAAVLVLIPFWAPLVLAAWTAELVQRPYRWLGQRLGGRHRGAAAVTVLLVLTLVVPMAVVVISLSGDAIELVKKAAGSGSTTSALQTVVTSDKGDQGFNHRELVAFAQKNGAGVWQLAQVVFGALVAFVLGTFIYLYGAYVFLVDGLRIRQWMFTHSPIASRHLSRFTAAFRETGRGLFIGVGLTALAQGVSATVGYFVLGIPQAAVLGLLTCIASLVPSFGAGLVWVPVTAGLALTGRPGAAVTMGLIGVFVSTADNFLRPLLARYGDLDMSTFLLLLAMLGGMVVFGTWGLVLGPLIVRLAMEGFRILREEAWIGPDQEMTVVEGKTGASSD
jgi:predicted PurR-regulated permease PerM